MRRQQTSAAIPWVCTFTFSFTAFWSESTPSGVPPWQGTWAQKITRFACLCIPWCGKYHIGVAHRHHPSLPTPQVRVPRMAPQGAHTDTQTQWEPPTGNSNKNMAVYSKRQTHLQRSSLSRKSDGLLPSRRRLLSLLRWVTFTSVVLKKKKKKTKEREKKETKARQAPYSES